MMCVVRMQDAPPPSRKRSRPPSAEGAQQRPEGDDTVEPASQRRCTGDTATEPPPAGAEQGAEAPLETSAAHRRSGSLLATANQAAASPDIEKAQDIQAGQSGQNAVRQEGPPVKQDDQQTLGDPGGAVKDPADPTVDEAAGGAHADGMESQRNEEHFQPSLPMQEMVVNFLLRMAFVIGGDRDHDLQVSVAQENTI